MPSVGSRTRHRVVVGEWPSVSSAAPRAARSDGPTSGDGRTSVDIEAVEGIGKTYAEKLAKAGVTSTDDLLEQGAKPSGRDALVASTGIDHSLILEWVNHVDLMRIKGV